ncbi:hypothetical protein [Nocardia cyriacigeorgica]|uniref:hypothetical protein n=1 Tax=Nocardia cyriacigeorgica TaxID=135487 RepID=UPI0022B29E81|nr:hypothetical protein [Nocardia cyriacigeorgica]
MVTGIGLLTAIGGDAATTWDALLAGHSGIRTITAYDPAPLRTRLGAEIDGFEPERFAARKALRMLNRGDQLGLAGGDACTGRCRHRSHRWARPPVRAVSRWQQGNLAPGRSDRQRHQDPP